MNRRMYVLTRNDLGPIYGSVQGAHALAQYAIDHKEAFVEWNNHYLIFLKVKDETRLDFWKNKLNIDGKKYSIFKEPDLNNQTTAIACLDFPEYFSKLPLAVV